MRKVEMIETFFHSGVEFKKNNCYYVLNVIMA